MTEKKTGCPPKYTEAQVMEGITIVEAAGEIPVGKTVKDAMCMHMGVSRGINAQSLDREVERLLDERNRERRERLVAALPVSTKSTAEEIGQVIEIAVLNHMAEEHEKLRSAAGRKLVEMKDDLSNQRAQIRELLEKAETRDQELADLEADKHDLEQRLATAGTEIASLTDRLSRLEREQDFRAQMLALMKETIGGQQPPSTA